MGEREESQRTAHARGKLISNENEYCSNDVTSFKAVLFSFRGKVLEGRQQQLELKMQRNREAQEESLRRREDLIKELELERELRRQEREQQESCRTAWLQEINAQVCL